MTPSTIRMNGDYGLFVDLPVPLKHAEIQILAQPHTQKLNNVPVGAVYDCACAVIDRAYSRRLDRLSHVDKRSAMKRVTRRKFVQTIGAFAH